MTLSWSFKLPSCCASIAALSRARSKILELPNLKQSKWQRLSDIINYRHHLPHAAHKLCILAIPLRAITGSHPT